MRASRSSTGARPRTSRTDPTSTFVKIAGHTGVTVESAGCVSANAADIAKALEVSEGALKYYGVETSRDLIALGVVPEIRTKR